MAPKRSSTEAALQPIQTTRHTAKRVRSASDTSSNSDVSPPSSTSAWKSSPVASAETAATRTSPVSSEVSSDSSSTDSDSDEESDSDDDAVDETREDALGRPQELPDLINITQTVSEPPMDPARVQSYARQLQARLDEFMPKLRQANNELATHGNRLSMEDVADDEQHIEMNLGLGVLEEKDGLSDDFKEIKTKPDNSDDAAGESDNQNDAMSRLLNVPASRGKASIQEVKDVEGQ